MKWFALPAALAAILLLLAGCPPPFSGLSAPVQVAEGTEPSPPPSPPPVFTLPPDTIRDVARRAAPQFTFETLLPVDLELTVRLYGRDAEGALVDAPLGTDSASIIATLETLSGRPVYAGKVPPDGVLRATVYLPAAPEDLLLRLTAPGFDRRSVIVRSAVSNATISRVMAMQQSIMVAGGPMLSLSGLIDSDGDGVPDIYDAFPDDPGSAFIQSIPADGVLTIAFEDLFGRANAGDADYNDFIAEYRIQEISNAQGRVTRIRVDATAIEKLAGYVHRFGIRIDSFAGTATLTGEYVDRYGVTIVRHPEAVSAPAEVVLFEDTHSVKGREAWFELEFDPEIPQHRDPDAGTPMLAAPPYNPYLIVFNSTSRAQQNSMMDRYDADPQSIVVYDVHLIDREPIEGSHTVPGERFVDGEGFPWALLVPTGWEHPAEGRRIDSDEWYPRFTDWRLSGGTEHTDWYNWKGQPWVPEPQIALVADIRPGASGSGPANLTVYDDALYFSANDGIYGTELWRYDGTSPTRVTDLRSGPSNSNPRFLTAYAGNLYFGADYDGGTLRGLFRHDGTAVERLPGIDAPGYLTPYGVDLFMYAHEPATGTELWRYDGIGGSIAADVNEGAASSDPQFLTEFGGLLYFQANDGQVGTELHRFDGVAAALVADIHPGGSSNPTRLTVHGGRLYFRATDGSGYGLWRYDGVTAPVQVTTGQTLHNSDMIVYAGSLYFAADGGSGYELWAYDGATLSQVTDLRPDAGNGLAVPAQMVVYNGEIFFAGDDGSTGVQLYRYDGVTVRLAARMNTGGSSNPSNFAVYGDRLYFQADDGDHGPELWVYY